MKRTVVAIYIDPDFYPPTINAILNLAKNCEEIIVISRNNSIANYPFPPNVYLRKIGKFSTVRNMEKQTIWLKILYFLRFTFSLFHYIKSRRTNLVLLYDHFALFAFYLIKKIKTNKTIWYHNHDIPGKDQRNYSIGAFAAKYEKRAMEYIDFFSLPSGERMKYYPQINKRIPVFIIPNYPSLKVYTDVKTKDNEKGVIKLIFQGFIGAGHSLEKIVELLPGDINGRSLQLILKGSVTNEYKSFLRELARKFNVSHKLTWIGIGPYSEMPMLTSSCHIGIGINMNTDIVSKTQGTASNKIYEYAASGLPVILFDSEQFRKYLDKYRWAFFTDGSPGSLKQCMELITGSLQELSDQARKDFEQELNFETAFCPVLQKVMTSVSIP